MILILCGKSCTGKDTLRANLVTYHGFMSITTITTRPKRDNERNGFDYNFVTLKEFEQLAHDGHLLEYRKFNTLVNGKHDTWYYGTPKYNLKSQKDYVIILDPNGAKNFIDYYGKGNCCLMCIESPDYLREERAMQRPNFNKTEWDRRVEADAVDFAPERLNDILYCYLCNELTEDILLENVLWQYDKWRNK